MSLVVLIIVNSPITMVLNYLHLMADKQAQWSQFLEISIRSSEGHKLVEVTETICTL